MKLLAASSKARATTTSHRIKANETHATVMTGLRQLMHLIPTSGQALDHSMVEDLDELVRQDSGGVATGLIHIIQ